MTPPSKLPESVREAAESELERREAEAYSKMLEDDVDRFSQGVAWLWEYLIKIDKETEVAFLAAYLDHFRSLMQDRSRLKELEAKLAQVDMEI